MTIARRLVALGAGLFLLGLLTGLAANALANPRMGLSAHLEGVLNGIFLIALGAVWGHVRLPLRQQRIAFVLIAYGTCANWLATLLAAVWGTGALTPLAAPGHAGAPWQEAVVRFGLVSLALAMIVGVALVLKGLLTRR